MAISLRRIQADIEAVARCTATPGAGATRPTFSSAWAQARAYVVGQAQAAGCELRVDSAGNLHARPPELGWDAKAWLVGSHIDSVPNGGDYDGVIGVVLGLELLRSAREDGLAGLAVELIEFAEEEGPTFGLGMLGSRAWVGELGAAELGGLRNADGQNFLEAGASHGVRPSDITSDRIDPDRYLGLIELHIEQGPGMWRRDQRLGVVRAIAGRRQYTVRVIGEANHAGATAMGDRRDALAAAAEMVIDLERLAADLGEDAVITVGKLDAAPNAVNVIAGSVVFAIDFRGPDDALLDRAHREIEDRLSGIADRRHVAVAVECTESIPARPMNAGLVAAVQRASAAVVGDACVPSLVSGALHDAAVVAPYIPTAMLFIPSRDGISHNPGEFSRIEDVAVAAEAVECMVRRSTLTMANDMPADDHLAAFGDVFEHSPWVVQRAAASRPFRDLDDWLASCRRVLADASEDERIALIRAHPDLVGRLARAGGLTADSTAEQRAAGLQDLTPSEAADFERYNVAYREKFGFPFVICARQNRKDAILKAMPLRQQNDRQAEIETALSEIVKIAGLRLADRVWED